MSNDNDTKALAVRSELITALSTETGYSGSQIQVIKDSIAKGVNDAELWLFLTTAKRTGLDPFTRQIHAVKRWSAKEGREVMAIQTGIDGLRLIAARTGQYLGQDGPYWKAKGGLWVDLWEEETPPYAARVGVYRKGCPTPTYGIVKWSGFAQKSSKTGALTGLWSTMPEHMLAKCAEAQALRKAFPQELSALRALEEQTTEDETDTGDFAQEMHARDTAYPVDPTQAASKRFNTAEAVDPEPPTKDELEIPDPVSAAAFLPFEMPERLRAVATEAVERIAPLTPVDYSDGKRTQERNRLITVLAAKKVSREDVLALLACLHTAQTGEVGSTDELAMNADPRFFGWICSDIKRLPLLVELAGWFRLERDS